MDDQAARQIGGKDPPFANGDSPSPGFAKNDGKSGVGRKGMIEIHEKAVPSSRRFPDALAAKLNLIRTAPSKDGARSRRCGDRC